MSATAISASERSEPTRRDFLTLSAAAFASVGMAAGLWPALDSMNPSADTKAAATTEVDLRPIKPGQIITVRWQGKPVFIAHRTPEQIARAEADDAAARLDPARDRDRVKRKEWLVVVGACTHLGCVPTSRGVGDLMPRFGGWVCPCHYSQYDISGRVRRGPAPTNLAVPPYTFMTPETLVVG
ncbi:MAG: ubiquinol-cytochrome c reductase iron-sulfur subunit [Hyphomicrobiaceae bacterium]|nr:MAG: ubiquinol-cytochrome c reductase iron-sulfur subunit [Hyphomicrobiaceae bacterium]